MDNTDGTLWAAFRACLSCSISQGARHFSQGNVLPSRLPGGQGAVPIARWWTCRSLWSPILHWTPHFQAACFQLTQLAGLGSRCGCASWKSCSPQASHDCDFRLYFTPKGWIGKIFLPKLLGQAVPPRWYAASSSSNTRSDFMSYPLFPICRLALSPEHLTSPSKGQLH